MASLGRNQEQNARVLAEAQATGVPSMAVAVNALAPGWIETDMTAAVRGEELKAMGETIRDLPGRARPGAVRRLAGLVRLA